MLRRTTLIVVSVLTALLSSALLASTQRPAAASVYEAPTHTNAIPTASTVPVVVTTPWPSTYGSLSGVAGAVCHNAARWPDIARANGIARPRLLQIGARLKVPCATGRAVKSAASVPKVTGVAGAGWVNPLVHYRLTTCYAMRWGQWHYGIDMAAPSGTPIHAASSGTVLEAGWVHRGYGYSVAIGHAGSAKTFYGHMIREIVSPGQRVKAGQTIGYVGSTGFSTGPHLHLGVHVGGGLFPLDTNPAKFLRARGVRIGC